MCKNGRFKTGKILSVFNATNGVGCAKREVSDMWAQAGSGTRRGGTSGLQRWWWAPVNRLVVQEERPGWWRGGEDPSGGLACRAIAQA